MLSGCAIGSTGEAAPSLSTITVTASAAPTRTVGPGSPGPAGSVGSTAQAAFGYVPGLVRSTGSDGAVTFDVHVPTLSGGDPAAAERFNDAMRASLASRTRTLGTSDRKITVRDAQLANEERSRVSYVGTRVVAGVLLTNYFMEGGAHPNNLIGTVVIATETAQPVLLTQVLPSPDALARVATLVRDDATRTSGPTPTLSDPAVDLANWLPSREGITFYVPVAHAAGDYWPVLLRWFDLRGIVPADVTALLSS